MSNKINIRGVSHLGEPIEDYVTPVISDEIQNIWAELRNEAFERKDA